MKALKIIALLAGNAIFVWHTVDIYHGGWLMLFGFTVSLVTAIADAHLLVQWAQKHQSRRR